MPLHSLGDLTPQLGEGAWAAPSADLIADVRLGPRASVWFGAVIRADNTPIVIGEDSNIHDGAMCHSDADFPLTIGARVTVGHHAILHGCSIADDCLVGMGARILNGAVIEPECIVGAGALITEGKHFAAGWSGNSPPKSARCYAPRPRIMRRRRRTMQWSCKGPSLNCRRTVAPSSVSHRARANQRRSRAPL